MAFVSKDFIRKDGEPLGKCECTSVASLMEKEIGGYGAVLRLNQLSTGKQYLHIICAGPEDALVSVVDKHGYKPVEMA